MRLLHVLGQKALESLKDERGQDLIEYGLLCLLIAVVVSAALPGLATAIKALFTVIPGAL